MKLAAYIFDYWRPRVDYVESVCEGGWTIRNFIPRAWFEFLAFILHIVMAFNGFKKDEETLFLQTVMVMYEKEEKE